MKYITIIYLILFLIFLYIINHLYFGNNKEHLIIIMEGENKITPNTVNTVSNDPLIVNNVIDDISNMYVNNNVLLDLINTKNVTATNIKVGPFNSNIIQMENNIINSINTVAETVTAETIVSKYIGGLLMGSSIKSNKIIGSEIIQNTYGAPLGDRMSEYYLQRGNTIYFIDNDIIFDGINNTKYIFNDIILAKNITCDVSPTYITKISDKTYYGTNMINFNTQIHDGSGVTVILPAGHTIIWFKICNNDTWYALKFVLNSTILYYFTGPNWSNNLSPDGSVSNCDQNLRWVPFTCLAGPLTTDTNVIVTPTFNNTTGCGTTNGLLFAGFATSKSLWNIVPLHNYSIFASIIPYGPYSTTTLGTTSRTLTNNLILWSLQSGINTFNMYVAVNGSDKLLYFVIYNIESLIGINYISMTVNGLPIERMLTTYNNPIATHYNGKKYNRYVAAKIPASTIALSQRVLQTNTRPSDLSPLSTSKIFYPMATTNTTNVTNNSLPQIYMGVMKVTIDVTNMSYDSTTTNVLNIIEIGTHDLLPV